MLPYAKVMLLPDTSKRDNLGLVAPRRRATLCAIAIGSAIVALSGAGKVVMLQPTLSRLRSMSITSLQRENYNNKTIKLREERRYQVLN